MTGRCDKCLRARRTAWWYVEELGGADMELCLPCVRELDAAGIELEPIEL